jgi:hypothetical protein
VANIITTKIQVAFSEVFTFGNELFLVQRVPAGQAMQNIGPSTQVSLFVPAADDEFGEKTVSVLLDGEESEMIFIDHPSAEMSVSELCFTTIGAQMLSERYEIMPPAWQMFVKWLLSKHHKLCFVELAHCKRGSLLRTCILFLAPS